MRWVFCDGICLRFYGLIGYMSDRAIIYVLFDEDGDI